MAYIELLNYKNNAEFEITQIGPPYWISLRSDRRLPDAAISYDFPYWTRLVIWLP